MAAQGDIVMVDDVLDPRGRNPKRRPCVIVSSPERIAAGGPFELVAITASPPPDPLPNDYVGLPWHPPGQTHCKTGLDKPNAAVCSWLFEAEASRVVARIGHVPFKKWLQIAAILRALHSGDAE